MAYRTILVYLDNESQSQTVLQVATNLARQHSAHLIGVYVKPPLQVYVSAEVAVPVYLMDDHDAFHKQLSGTLQSQFNAATSKEDFVSEWRYIESSPGSVADAVTEVARTADLVVVALGDTDEQNPSQREVREHILMEANRPVIMVPRSGNIETVGSNILVAWDGGSAATRAIFDSLPALQLADTVKVHRINPAGRDRHKIRGVPAEMVQTLSRHDINAELAESDARSGDVGEEILSYTREMGADLLVMGAYGHSRFREYLLGGVTRHVLDNLTMPVLMAH